MFTVFINNRTRKHKVLEGDFSATPNDPNFPEFLGYYVVNDDFRENITKVICNETYIPTMGFGKGPSGNMKIYVNPHTIDKMNTKHIHYANGIFFVLEHGVENGVISTIKRIFPPTEEYNMWTIAKYWNVPRKGL